MKKTKIICTMGPNTNDETMMRKLVQNGMDIARFNFSHGDHEEQKGRMDILQKIREEENKPIAILLDTKGPEIRTGVLKDGKKVQLEAGETFTLTTDEIRTLPLSVFTLAVELASRFLDDYLLGNVYFRTEYPEHNLVRTRCQLNMARDVMKKMEEMERIIKECVQG